MTVGWFGFNVMSAQTIQAVTGLVALNSLMALVGVAIAADVKSGLDLGEKTTPFNVKDITGPNKGKSLCYRCQYGAKPVAVVFTREINDEVASLVKEIDTTVGANKDKSMCAFVVLLTDDEPGQRAFYESLGYRETRDFGEGTLRAFVRFS